MGAYNYSAKSVFASRQVWLTALLIVAFLWTFILLSSAPSQPEAITTEPNRTSEAVEDDGFVSELAKDPLRIYVPPAEIPKHNPLDDIFSPNHKSKPTEEVATPEDLEAYHKGPPASEPPPQECAPTPFDISKCPSVQQVSENTKGNCPDGGSQRIENDRPLISYAYSESEFGRINLRFFVMHALHQAADFVFILNGETDAADTILPAGRPNIKIVKRDNTCFDLGAHAEVLSREENGARPLKDRYKRFILMNASIRGPFVPHWSKECWSEAYLGRLNEKVKLVGSTLNCRGGNNPHVQSMIWALDSEGLNAILEPEGIGECFDSMNAAIGGEIRTTGHIRSKGWSVDVMLSVFQTERDYKFVDCKNPGDFLFENSYYGFNVHPYETLFVKSHRGVDDNMLEKLTAWVDMSGYSSYDVCGK